ncbi:MAG: DNA topoisomerase I [Candidatus Heimdallarchaeum aukensis]|uniref:DNA topoisomerase n=1 Tax=Candidatus Heimdallarchaeum aukensis TaxID=2876573 RepID=A0A9Y1BIX1_9ARCH|nr:MAG: DNA topoisomerase I [Candidatus Heimdallarchaeum aukensis]
MPTSKITPPYIIGIAEKPQAANRLAWAIDEQNKPEKVDIKGVSVYLCKRNKKKIIIVPAIGHLFTLSQIGENWLYPALDFRWIPTYKEGKSKRTKKYVEVFQSLRNGTKDIIIMTDYDREGEVIGYLILKYVFGKENAKRMKFSTLTKRDINKAFDAMEKSLDIGFLNAGLLRHYVDWLYGINFTTALSNAYKRITGKFKLLSIGRVQGPTLFFIVEREEKINLFVPIPYWKISAEVKMGGNNLSVSYFKDKIDTLAEAQKISSECSSLEGTITDIKSEEKPIYNQPPFNLSELQRQAYWFFKFSPSKTLKIAEKLYLKGIISYPRTDSQKLPMTLGHKNILSKLSQISQYHELTEEILEKKKFKPFEGKKTDAAHPAIHPTGLPLDSQSTKDERNLFDLIVKKYLSVFAGPGKKIEKRIEISVNKHIFYFKGQELIEEGWMRYYKPYVSFEEKATPNVELNDKVIFNFIKHEKHFTKPPNRFNESTLLKKMEDEKLGTKATRADIITTLYTREYIEGIEIKPTLLGESIIRVLLKNFPLIITPTMTRNLEEMMDKIQEEKRELKSELISIQQELTETLKGFHEKEEVIGYELATDLHSMPNNNEQTTVLGKCPVCKKGELIIVKNKKTKKRFIACSAFRNPKIQCKATFPLPQYGNIYPTEEICEYDNLPMIKIENKKKTIISCISMDCPSKKSDKNEK